MVVTNGAGPTTVLKMEVDVMVALIRSLCVAHVVSGMIIAILMVGNITLNISQMLVKLCK